MRTHFFNGLRSFIIGPCWQGECRFRRYPCAIVPVFILHFTIMYTTIIIS